MKTIALFDILSNGHHPTYIGLFSQILLEIGYRVIVLCPKPSDPTNWIAQQYPKYLQHLFVFQVSEYQLPPFPGLGYTPRPIDRWFQWKYASFTIQRVAKQSGLFPDLVFFPWLDTYISEYLFPSLIDPIFPYAWSGLFFNPPYLLTGKTKRLPLLNLPLTPYSLTHSSRCKSIALIDEFEAAKLQERLEKPVITFPDLADSSSPDWSFPLVQQIQEKARKRKVVSLVGHLSYRKGISVLLEVAEKLQHDDWFFVFAGELAHNSFPPKELAKLEKIVSSRPENCLFYFNRIPEEAQFNALVSISDVLFASYLSFPYSSNLLAKASIFEKPIIVSKGFCMGRRVEEFNLGFSIPEGDVAECINVLHEIANGSQSANSDVLPGFQSYRCAHSTDQLRSAFYKICSYIS